MDITYLDELEPMDFYEAIIELSDGVDNQKAIQQDDNLVHGCQSRVWVVLKEDTVVFDSDSSFVKGLLTAITSQLSTIEDVRTVSMDNYNFLTVDKVSYQRLKGVDSFITRLRELSI
jgi:sulfur transfer protein SufE|tara:strand:- start:7927 stop:8277 length:351 start_codon:yes stop_codon:yes gene_type:complete